MGRVPVSLIIDDSTCLVNMAHFGIPEFAGKNETILYFDLKKGDSEIRFE